MFNVGYAVWAFAAGALIPVMAVLNANLARAAGNPAIAAATLFAVGFIASLTVALASGVHGVGGLFSARPQFFVGGIIVAFYIVSVTMLAPRFGVGNAILFIMTAQVFTSAAIDHFALFGAPSRPIDGLRIAGLVLLLAGLAVTQLGSRK